MPNCGGELDDDGDLQNCLKCDYSAPTGSHEPQTPMLSRVSKEHEGLKGRVIRWLKSRGFTTETEYGCELPRAVRLRRYRAPQKYVIPDVVGLKKGRPVVAVECGDCKRNKLDLLARGFPEVWHWPHGANAPKQIIRPARLKRLKFVYGVEVPNPYLANP